VKRAPVRHALEYAGYLFFKGLVRALPHRAARRLGAALGSTAYLLDRRHRDVVDANLALALPELDAAARRRVARDCFRHFGSTLCDTLSAARFDPVALCRRLTLDGWHHLDEAESAGRGVLILGSHLGNWEMLCPILALYRGGLRIMGRPPDNPHLARELLAWRRRYGNVALDKRGSVRDVLRALEARERVAILIDQRVKPAEGIRVPFFGRPAVTSPLPARLSLRTGAPVVPVFCFPEPRGRWRAEIHPPILPAGEGEEAVVALTRRYLAAAEREIGRRPHMWLWMHDRWKGGATVAEERHG
jgi:KDO2-lipid IV(A) lauroyltransferase